MTVIFYDDADARIRLLAARMRWNEREAAGCMRFLWGDSQAVGLCQARRSDILFWCKETDEGVGDRLIEALQDPAIRFIKKTGADLYEILGNKARIAQREAFKKQRTKASHKRWGISDSDSDMDSEPDADSKSDSNPVRISGSDPVVLCSVVECCEEDIAEGSDDPSDPPKKPGKAKKAKPAKTGEKSPSAIVFDAYAEEIKKRYGHEPPRGPKGYGQAKHLVTQFGAETAEALVRFYVRNNDPWYAKMRHALGQCVKSAETVYSLMQAAGAAKAIPVFTEANLDDLD